MPLEPRNRVLTREGDHHLVRVTSLHKSATWRSGYAADCKSVHPGSIPGVASTLPRSICRLGLRHVRRLRSASCSRSISTAGAVPRSTPRVAGRRVRRGCSCPWDRRARKLRPCASRSLSSRDRGSLHEGPTGSDPGPVVACRLSRAQSSLRFLATAVSPPRVALNRSSESSSSSRDGAMARSL